MPRVESRNPGPVPAHPWTDAGWGGGLLLALLVLAAYGPALSAGFIWDDDFHFAANPRMASWQGLLDIWTTRWALYYPLTSTTFWVLRRLIGLAPWAYHLFNVLVHLAAALALWRVLALLRVRGAWLGAALFALHPVQVESVAWITELKNTQSTLFTLLSVLYLEKCGLLADGKLHRHRWYTLSLVFFLCAILSKPSAVMLPPVLLLLLWWKDHLRTWHAASWTAPFFLAAALMAGWTIWEQRYSSGAEGFEWSLGFPDRLVTAGRIACFYIGRLAWPDPLMFIYPSLRLDASVLRSWMPLLSVAGVLLYLLFNVRVWGRGALVAAASYLVLLFPVLGFFNVYFMRYTEVADHFQYLPSIAPLALAGAGLATLGDAVRRRGGWGGGPAVAAVVLLGVLGAGTWRYAHTFHDNETLWRDCIAKNPGAWMAHNNLGLLHQGRGELTQAEMHYRAALAANPRHYEAMCNLGAVLMRRADLPAATALFQKAVKLRPDLPQALVNLGTVHEKLGERDEARALFTKALLANPGYGEAHVRLAALAERAGRVEEAIAHYRFALESATPDAREHAKFYNQRAAQLIQGGRWRDARHYLDEARRSDPASAETLQLQRALEQLQAVPP